MYEPCLKDMYPSETINYNLGHNDAIKDIKSQINIESSKERLNRNKYDDIQKVTTRLESLEKSFMLFGRQLIIWMSAGNRYEGMGWLFG